MSDTITYFKDQTSFFTKLAENISFALGEYQKYDKEDTLPVKELEELNVLDVNRYNKETLQKRIIEFVAQNNNKTFQQRVKTLFPYDVKYKSNFEKLMQINQEYSNAYEAEVNKVLINQKHSYYFHAKTNEKRENEEFIFREEVTNNYRIVSYLENFSKYTLQHLKVIEINEVSYCLGKFQGILINELRAFVQESQEIKEGKGYFSSNNLLRHLKILKKYGYSRIGEPLIIKYTKKLKNITCTCCISRYGVEAAQFFSEGGTKNEYFEQYFENLLHAAKQKYPNKKILFILDNLWAHKSTYIMRIMQDNSAYMLLTPSNTPEFSPIENLFGYAKKKLQDIQFQTKEQVVQTISNLIFKMEEHRFVGFYRNLLTTWLISG